VKSLSSASRQRRPITRAVRKNESQVALSRRAVAPARLQSSNNGEDSQSGAEVAEVRTVRPITELKPTVRRHDGTAVPEGNALCYTMPLPHPAE
jgi:hypothetical protein